MPSSRYKVQQFVWGFRTYDSYVEEAVDLGNEIARFNVNLAESELIRSGVALIEVVDGDLVVTEPVVEDEA